MNRSEARENAFILLFEVECRKEDTPQEIYQNALEYRDFKVNEYVKTVFFGVQERRKEIDELVEPCLVGWNKNRISPVSRAIISLSVFEMLALEDVPARVSINEAVELSKKYDDEKSYSFVNGVLNAVSKKLAAE